MLGLVSSKVYNSVFNVTEQNNKFKFYADTFVELSFTELKDEFEEIRSDSDFTPSHLQHETIRPRSVQAYKIVGSQKSSTDSYLIVLLG